MRGESNVADNPRAFGVDEGFHRAAWCERGVKLVHIRQPVELIYIEPVGAHNAQRIVQFLARTGSVAPSGLAGEDDFFAVRLERGAQPLLRVAV